MVPRCFGLCLAASLCLLAANVLAQETTRNLTIPSSTTTTGGTTSTNTSTNTNTNTNTNANANATAAHVNGTQSTGTTTLANNATQTAQATNSTRNATTTSSTPLKSIPDSTGGGSVPVPGAAGGKANGRYGPDDQYIAGVGRLAVPLAYVLGLSGLSLVIVSGGTL